MSFMAAPSSDDRRRSQRDPSTTPYSAPMRDRVRTDGVLRLCLCRSEVEDSQAAFLVSQKITAISSILASRLSATATSHEALVPPAPASLVASLNKVFSCGYFSKCAGLK